MKSIFVILLIVAYAAAELEYVAQWVDSKDISDKGEIFQQNSYAAANMASGSCSTKAGCFNGKCWAYCDWGTKYTKGNWCYTTKSATKDGKEVECTNDAECNPCWNCAGECGL